MRLGLCYLVLWCLSVIFVEGGQFTTIVQSFEPDCYYEQFYAQFTGNQMFFRFNIIEPRPFDGFDVKITSPTGLLIWEVSNSKGNHTVRNVRENGLHMICFTKTSSSAKAVQLFYLMDFASVGSRMLTAYPESGGTISKSAPNDFDDTAMYIQGGSKMGIFDFDMEDISKNTMHDKTRVMIQLSVEFAGKEREELQLLRIPDNYYDESLTWNKYRSLTENPSRLKVVDSYPVHTGEGIFFDVTDIMTSVLEGGENKLAFLVMKEGTDTTSKLFSMDHSTLDHWPTLVFEDLGSDTMRQIMDFKEYLFNLRGEINYLIHSERLSRDVVESTNSRVVWSCVFLNVMLIAMGAGQILYTRNLLKTGF